jgi:DNA-binding transcriptional LysR family regulator
MREEGSATRKVVLSSLRSQNITPSVLIEATNTEFIKEWVAQGKGISILVKRAIFDYEMQFLSMTPLTPPLFLEISMLVLKSMKYNIWIQKFIEQLKNASTNPFLQP